MTSTDYAALVRELRARRGLTQEQLANELGVSFTTINGWENGKRTPLPFLQKRLLEMVAEVDDAHDARRGEDDLQQNPDPMQDSKTHAKS